MGTASPRRTAFLRAVRADLRVVPMFGTLERRLAEVDAGGVDAIQVAAAALDHLGLGGRADDRVAPELIMPAAGQGAVAVTCRRAEDSTASLLAAVDDGFVRLAVETEREVIAAARGGCDAAAGALAEVRAGRLRLWRRSLGPTGAACASSAASPPPTPSRPSVSRRPLPPSSCRSADRAAGAPHRVSRPLARKTDSGSESFHVFVYCY